MNFKSIIINSTIRYFSNLCSLVCPVEDFLTIVGKDDGTEKLTWQERTEKGNIPTTFNDELAGGIGHWIPEPKAALKKT